MNLFDLSNFMASKGLPFHGNFNLDGTIKRYCKDNTKKKDEWYIGSFISDTHYWCTFGSWTQQETHKFRSWNTDSDVTPEQIQAYRNQVEIAEKQRKEDIRARMQNIHTEYALLEETKDHPYLKRKGIETPVKVKDNDLCIPLYNPAGELQTLQFIKPDGGKKFYPGLPFAGSRFVFGNPIKDKETLIAEGFATAYSLHAATGKPVICAFSAGNIPPVARQLKEAGYLITHAQDLGEAGDRTAKELQKINIVSVKPRFKDPKNGKDFNDLFLTEGKDAVFNCFSFPLCAINLIDLLTSDIPDIEWHIDDLIMKGSISLVWSAPGLGKSTFCYAMGLHATCGKEFIRRKIKKKLKVLYIDGEMTRSEIKSKINLVANAMEMTNEELPDPEYFKLINFEMWEEMYNEPLDLYSQRTRSLIDAHVSYFEPDLIFLDNLSSLTESDEVGYSNTEESWKDINKWLKTFIKRNMGTVIVHHANKSGTISGTGAILRSVVTEMELRKHSNNPDEELVFELHFNKTRHIYGKAKQPKIIYFDYQRNNYYKYPFASQTMSEEEYKDYLYHKTSHWFDLPIPPKEAKKK